MNNWLEASFQTASITRTVSNLNLCVCVVGQGPEGEGGGSRVSGCAQDEGSVGCC